MYRLPHLLPRIVSLSLLHTWLNSNLLRLNPTKTETIFSYISHYVLKRLTKSYHICFNINTIQQTCQEPCFPLRYYNVPIGTLSIYLHISHIHKHIHYRLHSLRIIHRSLPLHIVIVIASSYILSRIVYPNSVKIYKPLYIPYTTSLH